MINELQRRAILALMDVETARFAVDITARRAAQHRLHALIRERYGCKYSRLPVEHLKRLQVVSVSLPSFLRWKDIVVWLADGPLTSGTEAAI